MCSTRPVYSTVFLLVLTLLTCLTTIARAADEEADETEDYDVKVRVIRISLITGEVSLQRKDSTEWESAQLNSPLVEGDTISTGSQARVEIQISARNFVRLGANSILRINTLRDEGVALSVVEGTASIRLAKFAADKEYFEVDAPKTTLAAEKSGLYRIDVGRDGRVRLTARDGGRARIYSETSGFALRDGRAADLIIDGPDAGEWEMLTAARDLWDDWLDDRERYLAQRSRYDTQYYDNDVWGAEDLDTFGAWTFTTDYGWIWRPHASVLSSYTDWAPYRYGQWAWVNPYGWTWIGNEPWGWAPYHFGRWVYYNNAWAWCPRSQFYRKRSWWRPALVAFVVDVSFGSQICWYPLSYHHRDPRSRNYRRGDHDDRRNRRGHDDRDDRRRRPGHWGGVTSIPARDFGGRNPRPRRSDEREARRVVNAEPRPDGPGRPARNPNRAANGGNVANGGDGNRPDRRTWTRRDGSVPDPAVPQRRTGAAERNPGLPLDRELRRSRVWNGREARRQDVPVPTGGAGGVETRPTGAVERPTRANRGSDREGNREGSPRNDSDTGDRGPREARDDRGGNRSPEREDRTARPSREDRRPGAPPSTQPALPQAAPADAPVNIPSNEERRSTDRPARSEPDHRPSRGDREERPERRERNVDSPRQAPSERRGEPTAAPAQPSRSERPTRSEPPARSEPAQHYDSAPRQAPPERRDEPTTAPAQPSRSEPPTRSEPPARSEPAPRNDPPTRSEPAPRNDPPPRDDPTPRNDPPPPSEPVRSEPAPRSDPPPQVEPPPTPGESLSAEPARQA